MTEEKTKAAAMPEKVVGEADSLPKSIVRRLVKQNLSKLSKNSEISIFSDAIDALSETSRIFIHYISAASLYPTYTCSPQVTQNTKATLTLNSFQKGGDGGGPSECDHHYHDDDTPVVALSTGWYKGGSRCLNKIRINGNGRSVEAMVVDECDSTMGCDDEHDYQPPCPNYIFDASKAVWKALGVPKDNWGDLDITWSDA